MMQHRGRAYRVTSSRTDRGGASQRRLATVRLWWRRYGWKLSVGALAVVVLCQMLYPIDRTLPFTHVAGQSYGMQTRDSVKKKLAERFTKLQPEVRVSGESVTRLQLKDIGARLDVQASSEAALKYSWWQRLIPFSSIVLQPEANELIVKFDQKKLTQALKKQQDVLATKPKNASIQIADGVARITKEKPGVVVDVASLERALTMAQYTADRAIILEPQGSTEEPTRTSSDKSVQATLKDAKAALQKPLALQYADGKSDQVEAKVFGSWLAVREQEDNTISLGYDEAAIAKYLDDLYSKTLSAPAGVTKIQTVDGVETARTPGAVGRSIDGAASAASIGEGLIGKAGHQASVILKDVPPREEFDRQYTATPRGVSAYIHDTSESGDITISLAAPSLSAGGKASQSMTAASTYKLFVAVMLLHKIDAKDIKDDETIAGATVGSCLEKMIVQSDNPCAEGFVEKLKRRDINEFFYSRGYSRGTTFTHAETAKTTASDLTKLLQDITDAKDIKPESRERLLALMKRQQYRQGIPAGTGAAVADKVGFLGGVLNDAGTIAHPRGTYHLAILTNGQSWAKIAEITRKIESLMYP